MVRRTLLVLHRWIGVVLCVLPWLYNYRPLWDIVVIAFMLGGMALSATSLMLAWRAVGRTVRRVLRDRAIAAPMRTENVAYDTTPAI